jgi:hypothetical protein
MPLRFLIELGNRPLPTAVTCPRQLRHVTLLKATGLIEATLAISHAQQRSTTAAFVRGITSDGIQEIIDATGRSPACFNWHERNNLALEFLRFLERVDFPVIVKEKQECDSAAILINQRLIHGAVDDVEDGEHREAVIRGLTGVAREFFSRRIEDAATAPRTWPTSADMTVG